MAKETDNKTFDERPLARLLEAAFVLQQHTREHSAPPEVGQPPSPLAEKELAPTSEPSAAQAPISPTIPLEVPASEPTPAASTAVFEKLPAEISTADLPPAQIFSDAPFDPPVAPIPAEPAPALPPAALRSDYAQTVARIVDTQSQLRAGDLDLTQALSLVVSRLTEIAGAGGAAIAMLEGRTVLYRSVAGSMTLPAGTEVPLESALCEACLRAGQAIRAADVNSEFLLDLAQCRARGIQAMIAVPMNQEGAVTGAIELYYASPRPLGEQDVHTCQLMAGLVTEALAREEETNRKKSLAAQRAVMLEALERLKPNLAALVGSPAAASTAKRSGSASLTAPESIGPASPCGKCGHPLMAEENFCGKCGSPRSNDYEPPSMQSKVASLWHMQEALKNPAPGNGDAPRPSPFNFSESSPAEEKPMADSIEEEMPELFASPELRLARMVQAAQTQPESPRSATSLDLPALLDMSVPAKAKASHDTGASISAPNIPAPNIGAPSIGAPDIVAAHVVAPDDEKEIHPSETLPDSAVAAQTDEAEATALAKPAAAAPWSSARSARQFFEQLAGASNQGALARFWASRRGDIYLAIAVIFVAVVIRWGIWSSHSVSATGTPATAAAGHRKANPDADLSLTDRMLISLGLAEPPPAPEYRGNPNTQVWIDLHTALYYCPGDESYGKTPKGKYATQHDAQLDQYEPAYRKTCD